MVKFGSIIKKVLFGLSYGLILTAGIFIGNKLSQSKTSSIITDIPKIIEKPLEKYSIDNLKNKEIKRGSLVIGTKFDNDNDKLDAYIFKFSFSPDPASNKTKSTTGQINIPIDAKESPRPIIILIRGFVNQEIYTTGAGTKNAAMYFAENGYITVAPDFLGYGNSDSESGDIFESRFQTYTTILSLLKSLSDIKEWDGETLYLWGHSNGGQIAITVLEITGKDYPTTLWAPVSKPFPYSILYYTDESSDKGKLIRQELAKFENLYDAENYSLDNYLTYINAPLQIHQGTGDNAVPLSWSNNLVNKLRDLDKDITYYTYTGADHNLKPSWDSVVERDVTFFQSHRDNI
ncbi:hypothetical protein A3A76_02780 [Candidatus Woesebacteria bacterium RIFCSPLOWO2_01_FULL_39_23]|uniref:Peptidase S9 prolyl oligopeptidase catalytic domain-containing protein n=1 Tax=Candidatus Woesebacteria bacterium RIFCSPHIGHO2_01_FULL_40_22 TaxID=1802499 RepID=A0A1F7YJN0_9BACT|nr:MAG: hypothetical protein A2141_01240 [Candidatus Woesebacteria bacterium RBG_16_40_11]OGM27400.1 MAG: hypothetical protein A2628_01185 [Candidatus Woesebacteria bacterium RIFCSPHIGHO2_01_FULL_40_22]OGM36164.1 MAG: hypothetical protein A3E41_01465 [Candidatus Woesebacteria bacterium RIFCSPHIGHO2_12_FULL_38_9]OGM62572.1 MAG: hypothetical protein A3A76_02780 [Candidatus Woesebacteria bacterium RIFCSPLOWO2_01_FULL_39_23]